MTRVATILCANLLLLSCPNRQVTFTNSGGLTEAAPPKEFRDASGHTMTSPGGWPDCWLSSRISAVEAAIVAGEVVSETGIHWSGKFKYPEGKRHEYEGETQNPHAKGKCTLNWFGNDEDNANEPWINNQNSDPTKLGMQQKYGSGYAAVLTCTADATPQCHCITAIPSRPGPDSDFGVGLCVRKVPGTLLERPRAGEDFQLFNYYLPDPSLPLEHSSGRCRGARINVKALYRQQQEDIFRQQADKDLHINGNTCHLDVEPFKPKPEEATWYADEVRDWAVMTCKSDACRCFGIFAKSGTVDGARSRWFEYDTCVICGDKNGQPACSLADPNR